MVRDALRVGVGEAHPDCGGEIEPLQEPDTLSEAELELRVVGETREADPDQPERARAGRAGRDRAARRRVRRSGRRRRCRPRASSSGCGSRSRGSGAWSSPSGRSARAFAGGRQGHRPSGAARREAVADPRRRARKVSSLEIEMRSVESSSSRGSIPRARSRTSRPSLPGRTPARVRVVELCEVADRLDGRAREAGRGAGADPREKTDRKRGEEASLAPGTHGREPARLASIGGDLGDDLGAPDPDRAGEPRARADDGAHRLGERARVVEGRRHLAEIEIALVDPRLLDRRDDVAHDRPDLVGVLAVERHARGARRPPSDSGAAPRRRTSPRRSRSRARCSSPSRRPPVRGDPRRPRAGPAAARVARAPRRRRRRRRGRRAQRCAACSRG